MGEKIILPGGSGFLGMALAEYLLGKGYEPVILSRGPAKSANGIRYVQWDAARLDAWKNELEGANAVVNFTGKSVNCIYTKANKEEILSSRLDSVRVLKEAIEGCENPPDVFVQAGSLAIFGDTRELREESSPHGTGFSVEVCEKWENAFFANPLPDTRQVLLRIGFALGKNGGALEPLMKLAKMNLGGTVGSGKQYISWLHLEDLNRMFLEAIENPEVKGVYNATGTSPVTNKEFMAALRKAMGKRWAPPAPSPLVWLGAYAVMRTEPSLALTGRKCMPKRWLDEGFVFKHRDLEETLRKLV
ncbi:TIGR01777 family oxidoreductase [Metabacillus sp. GX 13764]|uniref:TIGR01777 family oxidoreductase n=1 Tax=Metabacillus kandeliae TaxID=2900151 RepID=UPI001E52F3B4|nr:TIGR01777 family oxidoreductase [Metabacillus kandeliae]MCD7034055.1 TIGR01777 family oxidoreductase [Metabacillus kandeliae]